MLNKLTAIALMLSIFTIASCNANVVVNDNDTYTVDENLSVDY